MFNLIGIHTEGMRTFSWQSIEGEDAEGPPVEHADPGEREVRITFSNLPRFEHLPEEEVLGAVADLLHNQGVSWIRPTGEVTAEWEVGLDSLGESFPGLFPMEWFTGKAYAAPIVEEGRLGKVVSFELTGE